MKEFAALLRFGKSTNDESKIWNDNDVNISINTGEGSRNPQVPRGNIGRERGLGVDRWTGGA